MPARTRPLADEAGEIPRSAFDRPGSMVAPVVVMAVSSVGLHFRTAGSVAAAFAGRGCLGAERLPAEEGQQVAVDLVRMRGRQTVRKSRIVDFGGVLDELRRLLRRILDRDDLIVLTVHDQGRDID